MNVCPNDIAKCVATAVMRNSESFRISGDAVWSMSSLISESGQFGQAGSQLKGD
jgi:hypothetical protein